MILDAAWAVSSAALAVLLFQAFRFRHHWPWLTAWLAATLLQMAAMIVVRSYGTGRRFFLVWTVSELLVFALLIGTNFEVYRKRAERRLIVGQTGRWVIGLAVALALGWFMWTTPQNLWDQNLQTALRIRSLVAISLSIAALLVWILYAVFPCPTERVVIRHHAAMTLYLAILGLFVGLQSVMSKEYFPFLNTLEFAVETAIFLVWAKVLGPIPTMQEPRRSPEADSLDAAQAQLTDAISQGQALARKTPDE